MLPTPSPYHAAQYTDINIKMQGWAAPVECKWVQVLNWDTASEAALWSLIHFFHEGNHFIVVLYSHTSHFINSNIYRYHSNHQFTCYYRTVQQWISKPASLNACTKRARPLPLWIKKKHCTESEATCLMYIVGSLVMCLLLLIDWLIDCIVVLRPTRHKIDHFGDIPEDKLLAWHGKTSPNTTKAHIHQSNEVYTTK